MHARTDQWSYRLSILLQLTIPVIHLPASFYVPRNPRWLIGNGRNEEAMNAYVHPRTNTSHEMLEQESQLIAAQEDENRNSFGGS
jgi:hypothetical protein